MTADLFPVRPGRDDRLSRLLALADDLERTIAALRIEIAMTARPAERQRGLAGARHNALVALACRAAVREYGGPSVAQDTGYDVVLDIFASQSSGRRISVMDVGAGTTIPATTSRRWINRLTELGIVERQGDPDDRRRHWIVLSKPMFDCLAAILEPVM